MEKPVRKKLRLDYNYGKPGYYFVTICAHQKRHLFGRVVGADVLIGPQVQYSQVGKIVQEVLSQMPAVDKFVVMPNHIHVIFHIDSGPMRTSAPTGNLPLLVRYLKRQVTEQSQCDIWQRSYYDHVIRNEAEYEKIWTYIDGNPGKWAEDKYFTEE